jgi:hypothetical protein
MDPKFPPKLRPISLWSTAVKLFEKQTLRTFQTHAEERSLLNESKFDFRADYSTTLQFMRLVDHVNLIFNNNMSTAAVFLDIEKAFDTTWHTALLYKLPELEFSTSLIKLILFFYWQKI